MNKKDKFLWSLKRKGKGITQIEIANAIGLSESMICKFEKDRRDMSPESFFKYKKYIENKKVDFD